MEALATHSKLSAWLAVWTAPLQVEGKEVDCLELPLNLNCDLVVLGVTGALKVESHMNHQQCESPFDKNIFLKAKSYLERNMKTTAISHTW